MSLCSSISRAVDEPLAATATVAGFWVAVEQSGPWGRNALVESELDPLLGAALDSVVGQAGGRAVLIRRPGAGLQSTVIGNGSPLAPRRAAQPPEADGRLRHVFVAYSDGVHSWLRVRRIRPQELLDVDWTTVAAGRPTQLEEVGSAAEGGQPAACLLVCTNGRRDTCCAVLGRPMALALADAHPSRVWECSHLGGHRFAPSILALPTLALYGRLGVAQGEALLTAAAALRVPPTGLRGRTYMSPVQQAAECAVRGLLAPPADRPLHVHAPAGQHVEVTADNGRRWVVRVGESVATPERPESCGGPDVAGRTWRTGIVEASPG